ncbi:LLM class flavin-dependent oxidoreductase [Amycolatopsis pigmentata]|uniref:LLM class flavin-dependent oxidoreductase n=1 Tax=Amycolatopsis pigmentata TaxID=450801 RepID=A0ABW5FQH3_9PSEU
MLVGGDGPTVFDRVLAYGDGWMPGHHEDQGFFRERVAELRERAAAAGRGHMEITIFLARLDSLDDYAAAGVDRVVVMLPTGEERKFLKGVAKAKDSR